MADAGNQGTAVVAPPKTPKWEADARERVKVGIRKFSKPLAEFLTRDANEGDTRLLVTDFLSEALGFDKFTDLATEYMVKGEFADFGVRIDKQLVAFIEVKRVATKLNQKHLRQVEMYAVNEGVEWLILTNGAVWQVYRLIAGLPVTIDLVLEVDLLDQTTVAKKADKLFYLARESFKRHQIEDVWKAAAATSPKALARVVLAEPSLEAMRKELRRSTGYAINAADLGRLLRETVIAPELTR